MVRPNSSSGIGTTVGLYLGLFAVVGGLGTGIDAIVGSSVDSGYGSEKAAAYAEQNGYTNAEVTEKHILWVGLQGCAKGDAVAYDIQADAPNGTKDVDIIVCKGIFKGATLREA